MSDAASFTISSGKNRALAISGHLIMFKEGETFEQAVTRYCQEKGIDGLTIEGTFIAPDKGKEIGNGR